MLPSKLAFVDIETTGLRASSDRIIEIGILRVEDNELVKTFQSFINPQTYLPKEITMMTGITTQDIENAPTFRSIKDEITDILKDCTFVAHNVRFDYAFLKHELLRERIRFSAKQFCTVRLSRHLFPHWPRHNLDVLIRECNITCENRHRAYDDARVLYDFYQQLLQTMSHDEIEQAIAKTMKKPSLPLHLPIEMLDTLPEKPGVYIFYGDASVIPAKAGIYGSPIKVGDDDVKDDEIKKGQLSKTIPLYVGKSINIKNRVLSHFSADISSPTEMKIAQQIKSIETVTTAGELGALLLESKMIKELLPIYNKKSRIKRELIALKKQANPQGYDICYLEPITTINPKMLQDFLGFFKSRKQAKASLADIAKNHMLCEKMLGLEKTKSACFAYRLNRCKGACIGKESTKLYNLRLQLALSENKILPWPYDGAILIQEDDGVHDFFGLQGKSDYFVIDNWCYMGTVTVDDEGSSKSTTFEEAMFDLDVYKILKQFLKNPANRKKVKNLTLKTETLRQP